MTTQETTTTDTFCGYCWPEDTYCDGLHEELVQRCDRGLSGGTIAVTTACPNAPARWLIADCDCHGRLRRWLRDVTAPSPKARASR